MCPHRGAEAALGIRVGVVPVKPDLTVVRIEIAVRDIAVSGKRQPPPNSAAAPEFPAEVATSASHYLLPHT